MKFDVIVGNPPYQSQTNSDKSSQGDFWYSFLTKSINLTKEFGLVAFITPRSWCGIGRIGTPKFKLNVFKENCPLWIDMDTSKHFPGVGITTCAFIMQKGRNGVSELKNVEGIGEINLNNHVALPFKISKISISVLDKILKMNSGRKYQFVEGAEKNRGYPKVAVIRSRFIPADKIFIDKNGDTENKWKSSMLIRSDELTGADSVFKSKLIKFVFTILGGPEGQSQTGILKNLPVVNLDRTWTDEDLYKHFNLTQEEIDYIESSIK